MKNPESSPPVMVLWHRPGRGQPWREVHAGTGQECTAMIGTSKLTGDWLTCHSGVDPNKRRVTT